MLSPLRAETGRDPPCVSSTTEKSPSTLLGGRRGTKIQAVSSLCEPPLFVSHSISIAKATCDCPQCPKLLHSIVEVYLFAKIMRKIFELNRGLLSATKGGLICVIIEAAPNTQPADLFVLFPLRHEILICECNHSSKVCFSTRHFYILTTSTEASLHITRHVSKLNLQYVNSSLPLIDNRLPQIILQSNHCIAQASSGMVLYLKVGLEDPIAM